MKLVAAMTPPYTKFSFRMDMAPPSRLTFTPFIGQAHHSSCQAHFVTSSDGAGVSAILFRPLANPANNGVCTTRLNNATP